MRELIIGGDIFTIRLGSNDWILRPDSHDDNPSFLRWSLCQCLENGVRKSPDSAFQGPFKAEYFRDAIAHLIPKRSGLPGLAWFVLSS